MKHKSLLIGILCLSLGTIAYAQQRPVSSHAPAKSSTMQGMDKLPVAETDGGKPFLNVLKEREEANSMTQDEFTMEQIAAILWAACGKTMPEGGKYTVFQTTEQPCIDIYMVNRNGIYRYDYEQNELNTIRRGMFLEKVILNGNMPIDAPLAFFFTFNPEKIHRDGTEDDNHIELVAGINCGAIMENIFLACSNNDLACRQVSISSTNKEALMKAIADTKSQIIYGLIIGRK